jgi:hypothetical protein
MKDADGHSFNHTFSDSDWNKLVTLKGKSSGKVALSEGPATTDGKVVFVTLKAPGGVRIYTLGAKTLFH